MTVAEHRHGGAGALDGAITVRVDSDARPARCPPGFVARALRRLIGWYQIGHQDRPSPCRFVPSCSTYALEAVEAHGAVKGSFLAIRRLLRCHPWGGHGFDPVPPSPSAGLERADRRV